MKPVTYAPVYSIKDALPPEGLDILVVGARYGNGFHGGIGWHLFGMLEGEKYPVAYTRDLPPLGGNGARALPADRFVLDKKIPRPCVDVVGNHGTILWTNYNGCAMGDYLWIPLAYLEATVWGENPGLEIVESKALLDPAFVHRNMLLGTIAWTPEMLRHLLGNNTQEKETNEP